MATPHWNGPPVWLHADLIPGNVVLRGGGVTGVLDFGTLTVGDPAYDVTATWHLMDERNRAVFLDAVRPDDATVRRTRGLVVSGGVIAQPYYLHTNPAMVAIARHGIEQVLDDVT